MTWAQSGSTFFQQSSPFPTSEEIPVGTYSLGFDPESIPGGYFLSTINDFTLPEKIYGNNNRYSDIIFNTFLEREGRFTTAALSGLKGSGKTLTMKQISLLAIANNIPVITIGVPYCGPTFNSWIQNIKQPVVILIDEFEKIYNEEDKRNKMLTFLDGVYASHKLVLLTMNTYLNNEKFPYFFNRPGRVYYNIHYGPIDQEIIKEFCQDRLINKELIPTIVSFSRRFTAFTLDILTILVSELNNNPSWSCEDVTSIINIKPDRTSNDITFKASVFDTDGNPLETVSYDQRSLKPNQVYIPYNFSENFINADLVRITVPVFDPDEFLNYYLDSSSKGPELSVDYFVDEVYNLSYANKTDEEYEKLLKEYKEACLKMKGRPLGTLSYAICLRSGFQHLIEHYQDPETRCIHVKSLVSGLSLIIEPQDEVRKKSNRIYTDF